MDRVVVLPVERLASLVPKIERVDGVFREIGAEPYLRNNGALQIVVAVDTHRVGVHRPAIVDAGERPDLPFHEGLRILRGGRERLLYNRVGLGEVEAFTWLDADPLHSREDRLVGDVRRMKFQELGRVSEIVL